MSTSVDPVYFETSWSILSSIGLLNVLIGFIVVGITSLSPITIVPIVVSAAGAVADGACYYAFYQKNPVTRAAVASGFADISWGVQEAGLSMYSYQILVRILHRRERRLFMSLYWPMMFIIWIFKIAITIERTQDVLNNSLSLVKLIDRLHIGYFVGIALIEMLSSYFLLQKFFAAQTSSTKMKMRAKVSLFQYLMRSTEVRCSTLALIGISRSITYSFQDTAQSATNVSGQIDRFVYTLEAMFPIIMFIDILAAKTHVVNEHYQVSDSRSRNAQDPKARNVTMDAQGSSWGINRSSSGQGVFQMSHIETKIGPSADRSSSRERIVNGSDESITDGKTGGINKTVEFDFREEDGSTV